MGRPASGNSGISRLDLAKMVVEDFIRQWRKMRAEHSRLLIAAAGTEKHRCVLNLGQYIMNINDQFILLSTEKQYPDAAAASASRFVENQQQQSAEIGGQQHHQRNIDSFQRELKGLQVIMSKKTNNPTMTEDNINYASGLNAALSAGLQLLSRYRLHNSQTENFGMGRLPNCAVQTANGTPATAALQPACLILVTDGACLRLPPNQGGGSLKLQFGSQPLRDLYREPFRWDQRIFVQAVGGRDGVTSGQYLHPQLRALCEVTGGAHWMVRGSSQLSSATDLLLKCVSPPMPRELPLPEPLYLKLSPGNPQQPTICIELSFVNGGPVCCFQSLEADESGKPAPVHRAMLLYVSSSYATVPFSAAQPQDPSAIAQQSNNVLLSPPLWCIPESFFPSKKLDTLPPRSGQPLLYFSKYPSNLGSKSFDPVQLIKMLHRFDQMISVNRKLMGQPIKCLHRDVYVCEWINPEGGKPLQVSISDARSEYFPVFVQGAGRPTLSEEQDMYLNIGVLHIPANSATLASQAGPSRLATLTLLPPEPHILLPLLIRAADAEYKVLKRLDVASHQTSGGGGSTAGLIQKQFASNSVVLLDEHWRSEFRAYLFRLPPYYQHALKRSLRIVLPSSAHALLNADEVEPMPLQCFSKICLQKIRNGEQVSRDNNERQERQEASLRGQTPDLKDEKPAVARYGHYDPRSSIDSYLAALRHMPPPWRVGYIQRQSGKTDEAQAIAETAHHPAPKSVLDTLGDLPAECLMAFYESRRRWLFGGPGLSTRGLHVEGVRNDGSNSQHCGNKPSESEECLLSVAGVGVSTLNRTSTTKMGEYRERLLFSRSPIVGYGSNDAAGVAATTAIDGSPKWSVDDDALPTAFFDPKTGEFSDSAQARMRSKLQVNFGNPYKERRADSLIPEKYLSQAPPRQQGGFGSVIGSPRTPPGSPPHDSFESVEEGEAIFVRTSPSRLSPKREEPDEPTITLPQKRPRAYSEDFDAKPPVPPQKPSSIPPPPSNPSTSQTTTAHQPRPRPPPPPPKRPPPPKPSQPPAPKPPNLPSQGAPKPRPSNQPSQKLSSDSNPIKPITQSIQPKLASQAPSAEILPQKSIAGSPSDQELENPDVKPNVDLPGWISVWSKSKKRWYFFDTKTNKSLWNWPP